MARYRANNFLFIADRLIQPGEEFTSDLQPGQNWEPLDAAAKKAAEKMQAERGAVHKAAEATGIGRKAPIASTVPIPDDWQSLSKPKRRALAMRLGALPTCTVVEADSFIEANLAHRAQVAA